MEERIKIDLMMNNQQKDGWFPSGGGGKGKLLEQLQGYGPPFITAFNKGMRGK